MQTAQAQVEAAEAQLEAAHDQVSFTELKADAEGVVTAIGAESGEVDSGRSDDRQARPRRRTGRGVRCASPAPALGAKRPKIDVQLADDPSVTAQRSRAGGLAPSRSRHADVPGEGRACTDPPEAMRLGATVTGTLQMDAVPMIEIPASALTKFNGQPAVWVVDPNTLTVSTRNVDIFRFDPATVTVSQGLDTGDIVVSAGVQALRPGQKVRLLGSES